MGLMNANPDWAAMYPMMYPMMCCWTATGGSTMVLWAGASVLGVWVHVVASVVVVPWGSHWKLELLPMIAAVGRDGQCLPLIVP